MLKFKYNVIIESNGKGKLINWGNEPNWIEANSKLLEDADRVTLVAKDNQEDLITVELDGDKRFILFSRVYGQIMRKTGQESKVRLYCIGWQDTIKGVNVKSLNWVYPNGMVENSEEPNFIHHFI